MRLGIIALSLASLAACTSELDGGGGLDPGRGDNFEPTVRYPGFGPDGQCFALQSEYATIGDGLEGSCDLRYTVLRPTYTLSDRGVCTDLLVTARTPYIYDGANWQNDSRGCFWDIKGYSNVKLPALGEVVRRCSLDGPALGGRGTVLGSISTYLASPGNGDLNNLRSECSGRLGAARITWEHLDAEYRAMEQKFRDIPRDLIFNTLSNVFGQYIEGSGARAELKIVAQIVFNLAIEQAKGNDDLATVLANDLTKRNLATAFTEHLEAKIPSRVVSGDARTQIISFLANSLAGETLKQAQTAVAGRTGPTADAVLLSFADSASDVLIGMAAAVGNKFFLGGVITTELQLLKAELKVLIAAIPNLLANQEATQSCDGYTDAFNNDRTMYAGISMECMRQAQADDPRQDGVQPNQPLLDLVRDRRIQACPATCSATCDADGWCR